MNRLQSYSSELEFYCRSHGIAYLIALFNALSPEGFSSVVVVASLKNAQKFTPFSIHIVWFINDRY